jgi:hypothetical protein
MEEVDELKQNSPYFETLPPEGYRNDYYLDYEVTEVLREKPSVIFEEVR